MGDTEKRIQEIEARLDKFEAEQEKTRDLLRGLIPEIKKELDSVKRLRPSADPPIDGALLVSRLSDITAQLGAIASRLR